MDIIKKRVIDWDLQLRKERDLNDKFGTNLSLSEIKELTGSFRRLTDKSKRNKQDKEKSINFFFELKFNRFWE